MATARVTDSFCTVPHKSCRTAKPGRPNHREDYQVDGEAVPEQRGQEAYGEELRAAQDHGGSALP